MSCRKLWFFLLFALWPYQLLAQSLIQVGVEYLTFEAEEARFEGASTGNISNKYDIEDSLWLSLRGSYGFSSDLYGFFDLTTKQEEQGDNLKLLASLSKGDFTFRTRRGEFKGDFSQTVEGGVHQNEEVDTKYFSLDLQYSLFGIRYLNFQAPTVIESPVLVSLIDDQSYSRDGLDPEFEFTGFELFFHIDSVSQALKRNQMESDWYLGGEVFLGYSEGKGKISDIGLENYQLAAGKPADDPEPIIQLMEYQIKLGAARDLQFNSGEQRVSLMAGYGVSWLAYSTESGGEFEDLKIFQEIFQHGPYISLGAVF